MRRALPAGTRLATLSPTGDPTEILIESLLPGTQLPGAGAVIALHPAPPVPRLILIRADALAPGIPSHDLRLPPDSTLCLPDLPTHLVPAAALLNSTSITRDPTPRPGYRLELPAPALLTLNATRVGHGTPLPILPPGQQLNTLRQAIAARAEAAQIPVEPPRPAPQPPKPPPAPPPLTVIAAGAALQLTETNPLTFTATLPPRTGPIRLRSTPRRHSDRADPRRFGICAQTITLDNLPIPLDSPSFGPGFHPAESNQLTSWRWTNGDAWLVLPYSPTPRTLTLTLTPWHTNLEPA